ncbi:MAG: bestrophin family protein, partial [Rhodopirellula sp. JB055]|uniref:bestrophin family protein n=1 Tax=Rhodopirellula sp. JB055 TaxID=3342846 RepID=UPI00370A6554
MLVRPRIPWSRLAQAIWPVATFSMVYSLAISAVDYWAPLDAYELPPGVATFPGTFLGIVLAFRTNSSYSRWWEARILWGRITNDSRTFARQLISFTKPSNSAGDNSEMIRRIVHRHIHWCHTLAASLRDEDVSSNLEGKVASNELQMYLQCRNAANRILLQQAIDLQQLHQSETLDRWQALELDRSLRRLTDHMGGCERIRHTPFPPMYAMLIHYLVFAFIISLPFALLEMPALGLIAFTVPVSIVFLAMEKVAQVLETPFADTPSCTPMLT